MRKVGVLHGVTWRGQNRRGVRDEKGAPHADTADEPSEPTLCEGCGAVYARRTWRSDRRLAPALLERATWATCPACSQRRSGMAYGRVVLRGAFAPPEEERARRRIANVTARARHTQPLRRVLSIDRVEGGLEILTTSQKLAHRIVSEMKKAFGGRATYAWDSRDGSLYATWTR